MKFWEIEMITSARGGYYEVVYMSDKTFDMLDGKYLKEIEDEVNRLKQLDVNKSYFGNDGWWELDYCHLNEEEQLTYNFDQPVENAFILYEAINEVLKKYGYDYDKEATEIYNYIQTLDCITTVKYQIKKSQVENLNKIVEDIKEEI